MNTFFSLFFLFCFFLLIIEELIINNLLIYGYISDDKQKPHNEFLVMSSAQNTTTAAASSSDATPAFQLNQKKLKELAENANAIKIGGKVSCDSNESVNKFSLFVFYLRRVQLVERRKSFIVQLTQMIKNYKVH